MVNSGYRWTLGVAYLVGLSGCSMGEAASSETFTPTTTTMVVTTTTTDAITTDEETSDIETTGDSDSEGTSGGETTDGPEAECGNGVVEGDEECDDGNDVQTDDCLNTCTAAICGDGVFHEGVEECDDGNDVDTDNCLNTCAVASCGDGIVHEGFEACDDGNDDEGDGCSNTCELTSCGDGMVQGEEECDDGNDDNTDECTDLCLNAICGDANIQAGVEECDDGGESEMCDDDCTPAECGDMVVNMTAGEACDDGNDDDTDECPTTCEMATCGDGFVQAGVEECDDGNTDDGDGCSAMCENEFCFAFTNDSNANLTNNAWLDNCLDTNGQTVTVTLYDQQMNEVYSASGTKVGTWSYDQITSTTTPQNQYHSNNHNRLVVLNNGDRLFIAGRNAANSGCGGSFGNGYGIVIYPSNPNYYSNPKMIVMPHMQYVAPYNNQVRGFNGWSANHEISWNNGAPMNTCSSTIAFQGTFTMRVSP